VVLVEDEIHVNLLPWVRATWIAHGQRQLVMTPGTNRRRTIFGAIDVRTGQWFYQLARKAVSATFTAFCEHLLAANPAAPVVAVVCDNVIIHRSKLVQAWLAAHPRLIVLHEARYSPHDNPVERIWAALKAWLANSPTLTIQGRIRQVYAFFRASSPAQRCWRLPCRPTHPGCPKVTYRTSRRPLFRQPAAQPSTRHPRCPTRNAAARCGSGQHPPWPDRHICSLVLSVDLVGPGRIWPAHVGWRVDRVGSRRLQSDRLDDQPDDQVPSDRNRKARRAVSCRRER
jgi:transposase